MLGSKATTFLISLLDFNYKQKNLSYPITKKIKFFKKLMVAVTFVGNPNICLIL